MAGYILSAAYYGCPGSSFYQLYSDHATSRALTRVASSSSTWSTIWTKDKTCSGAFVKFYSIINLPLYIVIKPKYIVIKYIHLIRVTCVILMTSAIFSPDFFQQLKENWKRRWRRCKQTSLSGVSLMMKCVRLCKTCRGHDTLYTMLLET